jgi:hypothetical protein
MSGLAGVLAAHVEVRPWGYRVECSCGKWEGRPRFRDDLRTDQHRAHVADAVLAWLESPEVVEAAARAINTADDAAVTQSNFGRLMATYDEQAAAALRAVGEVGRR